MIRSTKVSLLCLVLTLVSSVCSAVDGIVYVDQLYNPTPALLSTETLKANLTHKQWVMVGWFVQSVTVIDEGCVMDPFTNTGVTVYHCGIDKITLTPLKKPQVGTDYDYIIRKRTALAGGTFSYGTALFSNHKAAETPQP